MSLTGRGTTNWWFITRGTSKNKKNCKCRVFMESDSYSIDCIDSHEAAERACKELAEAWNRRAGDDEGN